MKYVCVRVYPSKTIKFAVRDLEGMRSWVRYNKRHRGNSLFVNGRQVKNTMESPVNISVIKKITTQLELNKPIDFMGPQIEIIGFSKVTRFGYPDDTEISRYKKTYYY